MRVIGFLSMVAWLVVLVGCGSADEAKREPVKVPAEVELAVPEAAIPEEFWEGVQSSVLLWRPAGAHSSFELPLTGGESVPVDFSRGGQLGFEGRSAEGHVLVEGKTEVDPWDAAAGQRKVILISLRRRG